MLNKSGITKTKGASPLELFFIVFNLAFIGKNFFGGKAKIKASVLVTLPDEKKARIIFVPCDKKRGWLALLSTDISIADEEIIRLYSKRWDIEVFFKRCKQYLKLVKEIQIRNYDGLIGHTSLVMARYNRVQYKKVTTCLNVKYRRNLAQEIVKTHCKKFII